ncbi:MAG: glycosyltransferase [Spirochaetes bacterium]|nr:glycosyltransferase [Spirochaetota bacterium]
MDKLFSVIIPTLNSERTLEMCLKSIVNQSVGRENIEILIIDGGSSDKTLEIAKNYGARILYNEKKNREFAVYKGIENSISKYLIFVDSDEVIPNNSAFEIRHKIFQENPNVKMIIHSGYISPPNSNWINHYSNYVGDPFTLFVYNENKKFPEFISRIRREFSKEDREDFIIIDKDKLKKEDLFVDICASLTVEKNSIFDIAPNYLNDTSLFSKTFNLYVYSKYDIAMLKNQPILHYSSENMSRYLKKLKWKTIVNVHYKDHPGTGFSNRNEFLSFKAKIKKYLFIPYSLSIIFPIAHSIILSLKNKNTTFLIHPFLSVYVSFQIIINLAKKLLGIKPKLGSYGGR